MKNHLPAVVAVVAVFILLIALTLSARFLQTPAQALHEEMAPKLEEAQRILANYAPDTDFFSELGDTPPGNTGADTPPSPEVQATLDLLDQLRNEHRQALRGAPSPAVRASAAEMRSERAAVDRALAAINEALAMSRGSGEDAVSGRTHPMATRLKAMLLYEKASLLRRQAAAQHDLASEARHDFRAVYSRWRETDASIRALEHRLQGGTLPGASSVSGAADDSGITSEDSTSERSATDPATAPRPAQTAGEASASPNEDNQESGSFFDLIRKTVTPDGQGAPESAGEGPADVPEIPPAQPPTRETASRTSPRVTAERLLSIDERKTQISRELETVKPRIAETEELVSGLEQQVADVRARLEEVVQRREAAQQEMFDLEEQKLDPLDPDALERFTRQYERAAETFREAEKQAQILKHGGIRGARFSTDDEEKLLTTPLAPSRPGEVLERAKGLIALQKELLAARDVLQAQTALRDELQGQLEALEQEREQINDELATYTTLRNEQRDAALVHAAEAMGHVRKAYGLEDEALDICTNTGPNAVSAARNAAAAEARETGEFMQSQPPVQGRPMPRLDFLPRYTGLLEADLAWLEARIQAQRAAGLEEHAGFLARTDRMNIATSTLLPEGTAPVGVPLALVQSDEARDVAESSYDAMLASANKAMELLDQAQGLSERWYVGATKAAIKYFLAQNVRTQQEAEALRAEALDLYLRVPEEVTEAQKLNPVIEGLSSAGAPSP